MHALPPNDMLEVTRLTREGQITEATALLQRLLRGEPAGAAPRPAAAPTRPAPPGARQPRVFDVEPETGKASASARAPEAGTRHEAVGGRFALPRVPDALRGLLDKVRSGAQPGMEGPMRPTPVQASLPAGARFAMQTFTNEAGSRAYKLYVPSTLRSGEPAPLVVMLLSLIHI